MSLALHVTRSPRSILLRGRRLYGVDIHGMQQSRSVACCKVDPIARCNVAPVFRWREGVVSPSLLHLASLTQVRLKHGAKKDKVGKGEKKRGGEEEGEGTLDDLADLKDTKQRYGRVLEGLKNEFQGIRGGKADPAMLDHVQVDMYGTMSNLSEVAQVSMKGPQLMMLTMYDPGMTEVVAAAVRDCDMGLNPSVDGQNQVSVPIPKTSKESRDALVKIAAKHAEKTKVVLRGIRHKVSDKVKKKKDLFSLDDVHVRLKEIDKITQEAEAEAMKMLEKKKNDILTV